MNIKGCYTAAITKSCLSSFGILYDSFDLHINDKLNFVKQQKLDLFIGDSYETCKELACAGIKSILMTTKMNSEIDSGDIVRVNNWKEIYNEIEKYRKQINL